MNGQSGFFARTVTDQGVLGEPWVYLYPGYLGSSLENALPTSDGGLLIGGTMSPTPSNSFNRVTLLKLGPDGVIEQDTVLGSGQGWAICRQVVEWNNSYWITVDGHLALPIDHTSPRAFQLNTNLGVQSSFQLPSLDHDTISLDSIPEGVLDLVPISSTRYIVSGRGFGVDGTMPLVIAADSAREVFHYWMPRSEYIMDFPPFLQSLSRTVDGELFYAVHENFQFGLSPPFTPFEPNRIHIYKVDTSLNIVCDHILDGFAENANYFVTRIKATDDGGFILMGSRRDMSDPSGYFEAWAQKFAAADCSVGLSEAVAEPAVLYPNPGREGFHLLLNGAAIAGALELLDATGRKVGQVPVQAGQAYFDARSLPAGLYLYRVLDRSGSAKATGRWVKE